MAKLKTIDIKGRAYVPVNARLKYFRDTFPQYQLITEIINHEDEFCLIKASVISKEGVVISTGHAYERTSQGFINKTSHVENCETSAVGRALAIFGIGIDAEVRSYEEMSNALDGQNTPKKKKGKENAYAKEQTIKKEDLEALIFNEVDTRTELSQMWIVLTKEQQEDKEIKNWYTMRKLQLGGQDVPGSK